MGSIFLIALILAVGYRFYRSSCYTAAINMINSSNYAQAKEQFERLGEYRDCSSYLSLLSAIEYIEQGKYEKAISELQSIDSLEDTSSWLFLAYYKYAQQLYAEGRFELSVDMLNRLASETASESEVDFTDWVYKSKLAYAQQLYAEKNYSQAIELLSSLKGYSEDKYPELVDWLYRAKYAYGKQLYAQGDYLQAIQFLDELKNFENSRDWLDKSKYALAMELLEQNNLHSAIRYFLDLGDYEQSAQYVDKILDSGIDIDVEVLYEAANIHFDTGVYWRALAEFQDLGSYRDSEKCVDETKKMLRQNLSTTVSVGQSYTVAVDRQRTALTTGFDPNGASNVSGWTNLVSISGFSDVTAGLESDGTVITTSNAINNEINGTDSSWENTDIVAISVGHAYIVGLNSDGTLRSAGHDRGDGQRDVDDWTNIIAIATGWRHTVGLNSTGNVLITGYGSVQQLNQMQSNKENWNHIIAIAAGGGNNNNIGKGHTVGLRNDGKVVAVGDNRFNQCEVDEWKDIIAIAAGDWFTMGLDKYGKVFITKPSEEIVQEYNLYTDVLNSENWPSTGLVAISAGGGSAVGLYDNGRVVAAGYGRYNQKINAGKWKDIMVYK